jgi:DNA (cytosine-5)-methyltransferase 1
VVGLFAGIGGIEEGLRRAGHESILLCEIDAAARAVLRDHFPEVRITRDVAKLRGLPDADVLAAGFPCQDLSPAGRSAGISGKNSSLVSEVFRLLSRKRRKPDWVLLENVPFMLQLQRGEAMRYITSRLRELGFTWAYRVVDARAFGLPQRRRRVVLLASTRHDPRDVIFRGNENERVSPPESMVACGFYWTEGNRGLGWAADAIPTLKSGSSLGIPSPPAIWLMNGMVGIPDIRDAERLQGFPVGWTKPAQLTGRRGVRWRLLGNAVPVPVATWVGRGLVSAVGTLPNADYSEIHPGRWPIAAWGDRLGRTYRADLSEWPVTWSYKGLNEFLRFPLQPLSQRAMRGFANRLAESRLRFSPEFFDDLQATLEAA